MYNYIYIHNVCIHVHQSLICLKCGPIWLNNTVCNIGNTFEPNNKDLHIHVHVINCAIWPKERTVQYLVRSSLS